MYKNCVLIIGFFLLESKYANGQVDLTQYFGKCKLSTPGFDDCVKDGINEMRPFFQHGLPEYGVDPFDPFYAEQIHQKRSGPFFNYKLVLRNVTESGWTQSQVTRFRTDIPKNMVQVTQFFPDKRLNGIYEIDGTFFGQKVKNSGSWNLALFDYVQTLSVTRKPQNNQNGQVMMRPPIKVKCNIQTCRKLELHIGNLAGGRTIVENMLDWVINSAWQPGFVILAPLINDLIDPRILWNILVSMYLRNIVLGTYATCMFKKCFLFKFKRSDKFPNNTPGPVRSGPKCDKNKPDGSASRKGRFPLC